MTGCRLGTRSVKRRPGVSGSRWRHEHERARVDASSAVPGPRPRSARVAGGPAGDSASGRRPACRSASGAGGRTRRCAVAGRHRTWVDPFLLWGWLPAEPRLVFVRATGDGPRTPRARSWTRQPIPRQTTTARARARRAPADEPRAGAAFCLFPDDRPAGRRCGRSGGSARASATIALRAARRTVAVDDRRQRTSCSSDRDDRRAGAPRSPLLPQPPVWPRRLSPGARGARPARRGARTGSARRSAPVAAAKGATPSGPPGVSALPRWDARRSSLAPIADRRLSAAASRVATAPGRASEPSAAVRARASCQRGAQLGLANRTASVS